MGLERQLARYKFKIDQQLVKFFSTQIKRAEKINSEAARAAEVLAEYTLRQGAKRIRGILTEVSFELFSRRKNKAITDVSMAMELIHSFLLIHDDFIDRDEKRRGRPTVHKIFSKLYHHKFDKDSEHFGAALAVVAGDLAGMLGNQLIAEAGFPAERKARALSLLYHNLATTAFGEILDILGGSSLKEILSVNKLKTAYYSFANPLCLGAVLAGAGSKKIELLKRYALKVGLAFQLQDDIIGLFGDPKQTGKPQGSDVREKRATLLIHEAKRLAGIKERRALAKIFNKARINNHDILMVQQIVDSAGALSYCQRMARDLAGQAKAILGRIDGVHQGRKDLLLALADFVVTRNH